MATGEIETQFNNLIPLGANDNDCNRKRSIGSGKGFDENKNLLLLGLNGFGGVEDETTTICDVIVDDTIQCSYELKNADEEEELGEMWKEKYDKCKVIIEEMKDRDASIEKKINEMFDDSVGEEQVDQKHSQEIDEEELGGNMKGKCQLMIDSLRNRDEFVEKKLKEIFDECDEKENIDPDLSKELDQEELDEAWEGKEQKCKEIIMEIKNRDAIIEKKINEMLDDDDEEDILIPFESDEVDLNELRNDWEVKEEKGVIIMKDRDVSITKKIDEIFEEKDEKENLNIEESKEVDQDEKETNCTWTKDNDGDELNDSLKEIEDICDDSKGNKNTTYIASEEKETKIAFSEDNHQSVTYLTPEFHLVTLDEEGNDYQKSEISYTERLRDCRSTPMRRKTTKPKEFKFATDSRVKQTPSSISDSERPFEARLRRDLTSPNYNSKPTLPSPFKFTISPRKLFYKKEAYETFAETVMKYETKPPSRYLKPSLDTDVTLVPEKTRPIKPRTTVPVSPKLRTKERIREKKVVSAKDIEEKEVKDMKSYQFKAREVNKKMVEMKGMYGVREIPASCYTETKSFNFEIDRRIEHRKKNMERKVEKEEKNQNGGRKSADSKRTRLTPTKVKAFSFETRDKERYTKKEERIKNYRLAEEKLHEFHARPLPTISHNLPAVPVKKTTKPQPFKLSGGSPSYHMKLEEKLKLEEEKEKAKRQFKAHPADVVKKEPFHPITGQHSPTNTINIILHSEVRAKQRAEFEYTKEERERRLAEELSRLEKEKQLEEEEQMKKLRKKLVHKASPIRTFKSLEILPSNVPVTIPKAPSFHVEKRAKSRAGSCTLFT